MIVYCVSRKPNGSTRNQNISALVDAVAVAGVVEPLGEDVAEALVVVGDEDQDQHDDRRAPTTCHHTEMLFMIAIRWPLKMFSSAASARIDHEHDEDPLQRVVVGPAVAEQVLKVRSMKVAQP